MKTSAELSKDGKEIIVTIPVCLKRRGGRKLIIAPEGAEMPPPRDDTLAKLVAKAHKWLHMLESGQVASIKALAEQETLDLSYTSRVLSLTLLAPDIIEAILDDRQPDVMTWRELRKPFPLEWEKQRERWGIPPRKA
ncbi:MAG: hypothetical protein HQL85_19645 [Magnetococcales bacterium]|nr:hypothetical protein [Magnetococcales bacterium]MBF0181522.1 hypothetical protein [Magnetococcales bacterium]